MAHNDAETIFERLEQHGRTWKLHVMSRCACVHRCHPLSPPEDRLATHFVPFAQFETDAAAGTLPDFALIEPNIVAGHGDYHPAFGRSFQGGNVDLGLDAPSAILAAKRSWSGFSTPTGPRPQSRAPTSGTPPC